LEQKSVQKGENTIVFNIRRHSRDKRGTSSKQQQRTRSKKEQFWSKRIRNCQKIFGFRAKFSGRAKLCDDSRLDPGFAPDIRPIQFREISPRTNIIKSTPLYIHLTSAFTVRSIGRTMQHHSFVLYAWLMKGNLVT
jgi:hypothetical protein